MVVTRNCIFCSGTPVTREHVFPQWKGAALARDPRGLPKPYKFERWSIEGDGPPSNRCAWSSAGPLDFVTKCVCSACNNGWMSQVEDQVKPIVIPLIEGRRQTFDSAMQAKLGLWATMKTMLAAYAQRDVLVVPEFWRSSVFEDRKPPEGWIVLATSYRGRRPALFAVHRLKLYNRESEEPSLDNQGMMLTVAIGYLAMKVIGVHRPGITNSTPELVQLWPASSHAVSWPPPIPLTDDEVEDFFSPTVLFKAPAN
jgi:hypothetical protein